ncbi:D-alanyl-D-alanine carboxypeptidase family protein [Chakrabartyella piscis]|uniref:D-alanyl-D-alanine carboxypeptidase family protein n=1 Tax=Chakrabartyella piscis TaxID=2918914 RepID=UPI0029589953|nr:D-alanyl-D-alanine carboxypeptidase family protein [Chakrabartyella piscis]
MKRIFLIFSLILTMTCSHITAFGADVENILTYKQANEPVVSAETAILMDAKTGDILYEKDSNKQMYPASITKLMTVLLALENSELTDEVTFSRNAVFSIEPNSAHIAIQEDEILTMEQCMYGILLRSANEVSNAVGEYVGGSMTDFATLMTERAATLGCLNTNFTNANGLFDENHYTTAYDMALIAKELWSIETFQELSESTYYEIPPTNKQVETRYLHGQHQMRNTTSSYYYEYAVGGKTGYVTESLNTLVTFAEKDGMELIAVVLKCNGGEHYVDSTALFEYGFNNFQTMEVFSATGISNTIEITDTYQEETISLGTVTAVPTASVYKTLPLSTNVSDVEYAIDCPETWIAPVDSGEAVGSVSILLDDVELYQVPIVTQSGIAALTDSEKAVMEKAEKLDLTKKTVATVVVVGIILFILLTGKGTIKRFKAKQRRKARAQERRERLAQEHENTYKQTLPARRPLSNKKPNTPRKAPNPYYNQKESQPRAPRSVSKPMERNHTSYTHRKSSYNENFNHRSD